MNIEQDKLLQFLYAELEGNLQVLIDPKKKNSFSENRIDSWKRLVGERIYMHLIENEND